MKKSSKKEKVSIQPEVEVDVAGLINKMQEQLVSLEKKIDTLINRPSPSQMQERHFDFDRSRHDDRERRFEHPRHDDRQGHDGGFRERSFFKVICADCNRECEVPFKPGSGRPVYCKECFSKRKSTEGGSFFKEKRDNTPVVRYENQGFGRKKRPFPGKRKRR